MPDNKTYYGRVKSDSERDRMMVGDWDDRTIKYAGLVEFYDPDSQVKYCCRFKYPIAGLYGWAGNGTIIILKEKIFNDPKKFLRACNKLTTLMAQHRVSCSRSKIREVQVT